MSIFHLFLSFSSFFCKTLFSFFPYFRLSSSTFLYISSFLPHLPPFLLLVFPIFLSSFPSLLPLFLLSFLLSFYLFPSSLFLYIFSLHFLPHLSSVFTLSFLSLLPHILLCVSLHFLFPSFLTSPSFPHASSISVFLSFLTLSSSSPFSYTSSCSVFLFVSFLPLLPSCPLLVFPPHFCLPVLPPSSSSSSPH